MNAELKKIKKPYDGPLRETLVNYGNYRKLINDIDVTAQALGIGIGEVIHAVTDFLGIEQCPRCRRWQPVLDRIRISAGKIKWVDIMNTVPHERNKIRVTWLDVN